MDPSRRARREAHRTPTVKEKGRSDESQNHPEHDRSQVHSERYAGPEHPDGTFGLLQFTTFDKSALLYDIMKSSHRDPRTLELIEQLCTYADDVPPVN